MLVMELAVVEVVAAATVMCAVLRAAPAVVLSAVKVIRSVAPTAVTMIPPVPDAVEVLRRA